MTSKNTPQQKGVLDIANKGGALSRACQEMARLQTNASNEVMDAVWHRDVQKNFSQLILAVMNYSAKYMPNTLEASYRRMKEEHDGNDGNQSEE